MWISAAAFYWWETGRLEAVGAFPGEPSLTERGVMDGVAGRYREMGERGELCTMGERVVPVGQFFSEALRRVEGHRIAAITCDRFRQAEMM